MFWPATRRLTQRDRTRGGYEIVEFERRAVSLCTCEPPDRCFPSAISIAVHCPKPRTVATDGAGRTGTDRCPTGGNCAQPGELGRQRDLSCRCGSGGGHGRCFLFARPRRGSLGS